jgi:hypothetical protein
VLLFLVPVMDENDFVSKHHQTLFRRERLHYRFLQQHFPATLEQLLPSE